MNIIKLSAIDSTNDYLKNLLLKNTLENYTIVTAEFQHKGKGTFIPQKESNPSQGSVNKKEEIEEIKLELFFDSKVMHNVVDIINSSHPYDEPNYFITDSLIKSRDVGSGMIGDRKIKFNELLEELKVKFGSKSIKYTKILNEDINKIAVCGGSGSFLINDAIKKGADVFITSDFKYHDFFDADTNFIIADIGPVSYTHLTLPTKA